jgi:DNA modification methylase
MKLNINNELKDLIPPLSQSEYSTLEQSIIDEGCRDKILTWNDTIIDGHNRYEICNRHKIPFATEDRDFDSIEDVKIWMIDNQKGRRNLSDGWKFELEQARKEILLEKGKKRHSETRKTTGNQYTGSLSIVDNDAKHNTQKEIASTLGWSTGKVAMADVVWKKAKPEIKEAVKSGDVSINQAYKDVSKEIKKEAIQQKRNELAEIGKSKSIDIDLRLGDFEDAFSDIPDGSVDCIITDPPYPYNYIECWTKLSRFAKRVLKPNGYCIAYSGQMYLPEVMQRLSENLDYYWTFAVYHEGQTQIVNGVNLICRWKPVLVFQNGKKKISNTIQDYFISEAREKEGHNWQQSLSGVTYLIEMFTEPGQLICEPFAGSGTTIKAAKKLNRNIIAAEIDETTYNIAKGSL